MEPDLVLAGEVVQAKDPNWQPLLNLAPECIDDFMWMFEVETEDGRRLHAYKHYWTRRYIHLDTSGAAFAYTERDRYQQVSAFSWLHLVLEPWAGAGDWTRPGCFPVRWDTDD